MNPAVGAFSWQAVPPPPASNHLPLACQSCQRSKSKCDRRSPCSHCVKFGVDCLASTRKPRSRGYKRKTKNEALKGRIAKLESILATLGSREDISNQRKISPVWKYIGAPFWRSLVTEIQELRDVIEEDLPHEENNCRSSADGAPPKYDWLMRSPETINVMPYTLPEPSAQLSATLCGVYCRNVNPLFRTFHAPTLEAFMIRGYPYLGRNHDGNCSKLVKAVVWFGATNTLSESECEMLFGQSRSNQLELFRRWVDVALIQANFLKANDVVILQALLMYIATSRQTDTSRRGWTLLSVAARQSLALGLNDETRTRAPFATELRRRLWHQLRFLDTFYALDRGEEPLIKATANAIPLPKNCNDVEFGVFSQEVPEYKSSLITDLTFPRMAYEAIGYMRRFSVAGMEMSGITWEQRLKVAERFREGMQKRYLRHCALLDPFQRMLHTICKSLIASVLLRAVLPMRERNSTSISPRVDDPYVLELALNSLKASEAVCSDPETRRWHWLLWVPWQPLAIALAGLCTIRDTELADETWVYVHKGWDRYSRHVADARKGLLWEPLEKLYRKATAFREEGRMSSSLGGSSSTMCNADRPSMFNSEVQLKPALMQTEGTWNETADGSFDITNAEWMAAGAEF